MSTRRTRTTTTTPLRTFLTQREKPSLASQSSIATITKSSLPMHSKPKPYESPRKTSLESDWDMTCLTHKDVSPQSPSPICSSSDDSTTTCSTNALNFFSRFPAMSSSSSTPSQQSSFTAWNGSIIEVDDCSTHVNRFGHLSLSNMQEMNSNFQQEYRGQPKISCSISEGSDRASPESLRFNSMTRPKPYSAFLDDVKKQEFEAAVEAWKRAQEEAITDRANKKEAVIREWEFRHNSKAKEELKKFEMKLEKMRAKALEKSQKSSSITKAEANKKVLKIRHEAKAKMAQVSKLLIKARATNSLSCLRL